MLFAKKICKGSTLVWAGIVFCIFSPVVGKRISVLIIKKNGDFTTQSKNAQLGSGHFWVSGLRWVHSVKALRRSMWKDHGRRGVPNRGTTFTVFVWMTYPPWGDLLERHFRLFSLFFIGIRERNITTTRKIIFESQLYSSPTVFASLFSIKETKRLYFYLKKFLLEASEVIRFVAVLGE